VASQTFQHSATTHVTIDHIWSRLNEPATWEDIPGVDRVLDPVFDSDGNLRGFDFETNVGGKTYRGVATPAGREDRRLVAWDVRTSELEGTVMVALSPIGDGTRVYVRLHVMSAGLLGGLFFPVVAGAIGGGFHATVDHFVEVLAG
jgi:hypothetical protein